jgi:hypothetical protein
MPEKNITIADKIHIVAFEEVKKEESQLLLKEDWVIVTLSMAESKWNEFKRTIQ